MGSEVKCRLVNLCVDDTLTKTSIASCGEVLDSAAHSSLLAVDPVKYVNKMPIDQMLP
ncbi:unnamed protein product [Urochloa humidicola]